MRFCAICTRATSDLERSEDGYLECAGCRGGAPVRLGPERGYEPPYSPGDVSAAVRASKAPAVAASPWKQRNQASPVDPGYELVRVRVRKPGGRTIDANEAWHELGADQAIKHRGSTTVYHLFQRPKPKRVAEAVDVVALLEPYRSKE